MTVTTKAKEFLSVIADALQVLSFIGVSFAALGAALVAATGWLTNVDPFWLACSVPVSFLLLAKGYSIFIHATRTRISPDLRVWPLGFNCFVRNGQTAVAIHTKVWNNGKPCVAISWELYIFAPGQAPALAVFTQTPEELPLDGTPAEVMRRCDSLDERTATDPVTDRPLYGRVLFMVRLAKSQVEHPDTRLEFSVVDSLEKKATASRRMGNWSGR